MVNSAGVSSVVPVVLINKLFTLIAKLIMKSYSKKKGCVLRCREPWSIVTGVYNNECDVVKKLFCLQKVTSPRFPFKICFIHSLWRDLKLHAVNLSSPHYYHLGKWWQLLTGDNKHLWSNFWKRTIELLISMSCCKLSLIGCLPLLLATAVEEYNSTLEIIYYFTGKSLPL